MTPENTRRKDACLVVRLTPDQDSLIRAAAAITGQSLTEFIAILDRRARRLPELAALLAERAPWEK